MTKIDAVAFNTVTPGSGGQSYGEENAYVAAYMGRSSQKPVCTHCWKMGHTVQKCYKLHGFPPGYKTPANPPKPSFQPRM